MADVVIPQTPDSELMELHGDPHPARIWGYLGEDESQRLTWLAARVPPALSIVEIGSLRGRSTARLGLGAAAGLGAHVYAIDMWGPYSPASGLKGGDQHRERFDINMEMFGLTERVTPIRADSREVAKVWQRQIGLLFIDGEHTYKGIQADYEGFHKHIPEGGWLAIHDYCPHFGQVKAFVDECVLTAGLWENVSLRHTLLTMRRRAAAA